MGDKIRKSPNIRFAGFTDDWEERKLREIAKYRNGKAHENDIDVNGKYIVVNSKFVSTEGKIQKFSNIQNQPLYENEIAFVLSDVPNGRAIARTFLVDKSEKYTLNQRIAGITPLENTYPYFLYILMNRNRYFLRFDDGAKQTNLSVDDVMEFEEYYPEKEEQKAIGDYFSQLDNLITLHKRKLDLLKATKKSMLQKMFPKNGESVPEIRFAGFTGDWEERKVQELIDDGIINAPMDGNHGEKHPTTSDYVSTGIPFIMARDIGNGKVDLNHCNFITKERSEKLDKGFAQNGDVLLTHKATIGETAIVDGLKTHYAVLTPQVTYYRILDKDKLCRYYLYALFNSEGFQNKLKIEAIQSTRAYIGIMDQRNLLVSLPQNIDEQNKIGDYFQNLDNLITLHQRELDLLKDLKKSMLKQMFI